MMNVGRQERRKGDVDAKIGSQYRGASNKW